MKKYYKKNTKIKKYKLTEKYFFGMLYLKIKILFY